MKNKTLLVAVCLTFAIIARSQAQTPSTNDVWDVSHGITILAHSPLDDALGDPLSYDAANIFGATNGTFIEGAAGNVVFTDFQPPGFVHFVEWRTPAPVTVRSFRLFAAGDAIDSHREFAVFRLLAKTEGSPTFDRTLFTLTPSHPYVYADISNGLLIASRIRPVTAQEFRAEFVNLAGLPRTDNGPRIVELDGFSRFLDTKSSIRLSQVEICWDASQGIQYQVEYQTALSGGAWQPLGSPITGDGTRMCITDPVAPESPRRFYRVRPLEEL